MAKKIFSIDGANFTDLDGFYGEISAHLIPGHQWGRNLDAFNDILHGGYGTPRRGFTFVWKHSDQSKQALSYPATVKFLQELWLQQTEGFNYDELASRDYEELKKTKPHLKEAELLDRVQSRRDEYRQLAHRLAQAKQNRGETIFDWLVAIFHKHENVELRLE